MSVNDAVFKSMERAKDHAWLKGRSDAIREFCESAGIPASVEALNLPDDVKIYRMKAAVESRHELSEWFYKEEGEADG